MKTSRQSLLTHCFSAAAAFALGALVMWCLHNERPARVSVSNELRVRPVSTGSAEPDKPRASSAWRSAIVEREASAARLDEHGLIAALREIDAGVPNASSMASRHLLIAMLADRSPQSALGYAESLPAASRPAAALTVYMAWAARDPAAAAAHFSDGDHIFGTLSASQREAAGALAAAWAERDPDAAAAWAEDLPEDQRGQALSQIIGVINRADPVRAADFINDMPEGYERTELIQSVVKQQATQAPDKMGAWVLSIDGSAEQKAAAATLVSTWAAKDPAAAAAWASALQPGLTRDAAAAALVDAPAFNAGPEATLAWVASIRDPALRASALRTAARRHDHPDWLTAEGR